MNTSVQNVQAVPRDGEIAPLPGLPRILYPTPREAVNLFTAGFGGAALGLALLPKTVARTMSWGYGSGWQREIAIWNLGTLTAACALRKPGSQVDTSLLRGFVTLSGLFAANHLAAAFKSPKSIGHWATAAMNLSSVVLGVSALRKPSDGQN
jgi:hypothetical protein